MVLRRYECFVHLKRPLDGLDNAKDHRKYQDKSSKPESVPLNSSSPIIPPLTEPPGFSVVKYLLQYYQTVTPVVKSLDLTIICFQAANFQ